MPGETGGTTNGVNLPAWGSWGWRLRREGGAERSMRSPPDKIAAPLIACGGEINRAAGQDETSHIDDCESGKLSTGGFHGIAPFLPLNPVAA